MCLKTRSTDSDKAVVDVVKVEEDVVDRSRNRLFCPECHMPGRKLSLQVDYKHFSADCPRSRAAINLMLAEEEEMFEENGNLNV